MMIQNDHLTLSLTTYIERYLLANELLWARPKTSTKNHITD